MDNSLKSQHSSRPQQVVTIHDVAREAGVTIGTVSKALNGQGKLRPETRELVRSVAERLGFRPNDLAQSLMRGRSFTVGLITTDSYGRFSIPLMLGIEDTLGSAQISVFLCDARDDPMREQQHIASLLAKRVDGIIVTGRRIDPRPPIDVGNIHIPVLYAYTQVTDPGALCILPDDEQLSSSSTRVMCVSSANGRQGTTSSLISQCPSNGSTLTHPFVMMLALSRCNEARWSTALKPLIMPYRWI